MPDGELQILNCSFQKVVVSVQSLSNLPETSQHGSNNCNQVLPDEQAQLHLTLWLHFWTQFQYSFQAPEF